jgi:hypothetical protein
MKRKSGHHKNKKAPPQGRSKCQDKTSGKNKSKKKHGLKTGHYRSNPRTPRLRRRPLHSREFAKS